MEYLIISLILLFGIMIYIIINLYIKVRRAEKLIIHNEFAANQRFVEFYIEFRKAHERMNTVDRKGIFKTEDEVGYTFKIIKDIVDTMDEDFKLILSDGPQKG